MLLQNDISVRTSKYKIIIRFVFLNLNMLHFNIFKTATLNLAELFQKLIRFHSYLSKCFARFMAFVCISIFMPAFFYNLTKHELHHVSVLSQNYFAVLI